MTSRWDKNEKKRLIELFSKGVSYSDIANKLDRSESAIRLRLQSIVYDGVERDLTIPDLMEILSTDQHTILQLLYAHREFKEGRGEHVLPFSKLDDLFQIKIRKGKKSKPKSEIPSELLGGSANAQSSDNHNDIHNNNHSKRDNHSKHDNPEYIRKIEMQNEAMEQIIKNKILKKQMKTLYRANGLTEKEKDELKKIL